VLGDGGSQFTSEVVLAVVLDFIEFLNGHGHRAPDSLVLDVFCDDGESGVGGYRETDGMGEGEGSEGVDG
jgi:hypothetical protein